jgi:hypothetical protein
MPNLKIRSKVLQWKNTNREEIMKLLEFLLLQGTEQKPDNKSYFSMRKTLETHIFSELFTERRFHLLLKFLHFVMFIMNIMKKTHAVPEDCTN